MFFHNWMDLFRTAVVGISAHAALLILVRISRKRTLSKMNAFDLILTVALGSTLATILLSKETALTEGILARALLIFLQLIITSLSVREETVSHPVKAEPVRKEEVLRAMRSQGVASLKQVALCSLHSLQRNASC